MAAQGGSASAANDAFYPHGNPDTVVTGKENRLKAPVSKTAPDLAALSLDDSQLLSRPDYGTLGKSFVVSSNYRKVMVKPDITIWPYAIKVFTQEANGDLKEADLPKRKLRGVVEKLHSKCQIQKENAAFATDFAKNIYSTQKLSSHRYNVTHTLPNEPETSNRAKHYVIELVSLNPLPLSNIYKHLDDANADPKYSPSEDVIQAVNIILNHNAKARALSIFPQIMTSNSNTFFAIEGPLLQKRKLGGGLEAWKGVFSSFRPATGRALLQTQVQHAAAYEPGPLTNLMKSHLEHNRTYLSRLNELSLLKLERFLKGVRVRTIHLQAEKGLDGNVVIRPMTIWGLAIKKSEKLIVTNKPVGLGTPVKIEKSPHVKKDGKKAWPWKVSQGKLPLPMNVLFDKTKDKNLGEWISVLEYFNEVHNRRVAMEYPVVNVGSELQPVWMPADVLEVLPGQAARVNLSGEQTKAMVNFAVQKPQVNYQTLMDKSLPILGLDENSDPMTLFGLSVDHRFVKVPARILATPKVVYGQTGAAFPKFGAWNMGGKQFFKGSSLESWTVICIKSGKTADDAWANGPRLKDPINACQEEIQRCGVNLPPVDVSSSRPLISFTVEKDSLGRFNLKMIEAAFAAVKARGAKLVLVLMSKFDDANRSVYNKVKIEGDVKIGVHTVCAHGAKFIKPRENKDLDKRVSQFDTQFYANLGLKFNLKLGGQNHALNADKLSLIAQGKTMVVGLDVSHPSPGSKADCKSVVGIVASIDASLGQWPAGMCAQEGGEEKVEALKSLFVGRLRTWQKHNNDRLPENILLYRDGVSEGQIAKLIPKEIAMIKDAFSIYGTRPHPKLCVIVCGKRHKTRFYPLQENLKKSEFTLEKTGNVANGTVIDRGITQAGRSDFYLVAHGAIQGTARPCHYDVVYDTVFRDNTKLNVGGCRNPMDVLQNLTHNLCHLFGRATKATSLCPPAYYADLLCTRLRCYMASSFDVEATSGGDDIPELPENIRNTMFYI